MGFTASIQATAVIQWELDHFVLYVLREVLMLKANVDYQLRQSQFPGQYRMSRLDYPLDECHADMGSPGVVCETVFPPMEPD